MRDCVKLLVSCDGVSARRILIPLVWQQSIAPGLNKFLAHLLPGLALAGLRFLRRNHACCDKGHYTKCECWPLHNLLHNSPKTAGRTSMERRLLRPDERDITKRS